jgi:hypothetical protein
MGQTQLARPSSNLTSKQGETREQGCDCPRNKRTVLGYPLQHGERDGEWELWTADSAGQSFALSGHSAKCRAQTLLPWPTAAFWGPGLAGRAEHRVRKGQLMGGRPPRR